MRILITGCCSGIGPETARRLLSIGHELIGVSRRCPAIAGDRFYGVEDDPGAVGIKPDEWLSAERTVEGFVYAAGVRHTACIEAQDMVCAEAMWRLHVEAPARRHSALTCQSHPLSRAVLLARKRSLVNQFGDSAAVLSRHGVPSSKR